MKTYFHSIKITLYLIKYIYIIPTFFSWYCNIFLFNQNKFVFNEIYFYYITFFFHDIEIFLFSQNKFVFKKKKICHIYVFFIQVKYIFTVWIFHGILFWWAYLVFHLYLQKSEFYFQYVNWTTTRKCEKAAKKNIRILCYES